MTPHLSKDGWEWPDSGVLGLGETPAGTKLAITPRKAETVTVLRDQQRKWPLGSLLANGHSLCAGGNKTLERPVIQAHQHNSMNSINHLKLMS